MTRRVKSFFTSASPTSISKSKGTPSPLVGVGGGCPRFTVVLVAVLRTCSSTVYLWRFVVVTPPGGDA